MLRSEDFGTIDPAMQQTSLLFPRKISHPLATKALMIVLSIGAHYLIASNLGVFGSFTPLKLKSGGGTVKVVSLTPAERARVPEAVKSNPLPIAQNPVNPAPATRNFAGFSTTPAIPSAKPPNPAANSTPQPQSGSTTNPSNNPSSSPSSRPASEQSTARRDPFDRNNRFSTMPRGSQSNNNGESTQKPNPGPSSSQPSNPRPNPVNGNTPPLTPSESPPSKPPSKPPNGEPVNKNKPFQEKLNIATNLIKNQYPGQEIVTENIPVSVTDGSNVVSGLSGPKQYFEIAYFYGNGDMENPIFTVPLDPSIISLLGPQKTERLLNAAQAKAMEAYEQRLKRSPDSAKNKIFRYAIKIAISSR
jgi:hypothetical protein